MWTHHGTKQHATHVEEGLAAHLTSFLFRLWYWPTMVRKYFDSMQQHLPVHAHQCTNPLVCTSGGSLTSSSTAVLLRHQFSFFKSSLFSHFGCIHEIHEIHGLHIFSDSLKVSMNFLCKSRILIYDRFIPLSIWIDWKILVIFDVCSDPNTKLLTMCRPFLKTISCLEQWTLPFTHSSRIRVNVSPHKLSHVLIPFPCILWRV